MVSGSLGERIAAYRRRRGLSQAALAGLVGRSESWLSQVERGVRSVDRLSVLLGMAKVLHVDVEALTGQPWQYAPNGGSVAVGLDHVRTFFAGYHGLLDVAHGSPVNTVDLRGRIESAHASYQAAEYERVIEDLPELLSMADSIRTAPLGEDRRDAMSAYVSAYAVAAKLLTKMGAADLALLSADRAAMVAVDAESVEARGMAAYQVACALLRNDRPEDAERIAVQMAEHVQRDARPDAPTVISFAGALWLIAAIIAARRTNRAEAWHRLNQAENLAELLGVDGNFGWTAFGPTNVAIHRVSAAAELGDPGEALRASDAVETDRLPAGLKSRRAQVHLDLAWAQAQRKRDADAVLHLMEAERIAPAMVRYNVIVRELVREMMAREKRSKTSALHQLAVRAGVLD